MQAVSFRIRRLLLVMIVFLGAQMIAQPAALAQEELPDVPEGDFRLVVKEAFIIEQMEGQFRSLINNLSAYGIPMEEPVIDLRPGNKIDVSATTELPLGNRTLSVRPTVTIALAAEDNQMTLSIESVSLEGLALPASLIAPQIEGIQEQLQTQINSALRSAARLGGLELVAIGTTEEVLILDFDFTLEFYRTDEAVE